MHRLLCALAALADSGQSTGPPQSAAPSAPAAGQSDIAPDTQPDDVVIVGRRGGADIPPEREYGPDEIDSLDAYDIHEVIRRIAEGDALGDAPVVIVNGRRVADPGIFLNFPPDALTRVEVLPPEAGATYGSEPSRRVLNIVLQKKFRSRDGQFDAKAPTAGGTTTLNIDARQGAISGGNVNQFGVRGSRDSPLFAAERPAYLRDHPDDGAISLRGESKRIGGNLALNRALGDWSASLNLQPQASENRSVSRGDDGPIESRNAARSLSATVGLNGEVAGWSLQASLAGAMSHDRRTGIASSTSGQQSLSATLSLNRQLIRLPAGPLVVNLTGTAARSRSTVVTSAGGRQVFPAHALGLNGSLAIPLWRAPAPGAGSFVGRLLGSMSVTLNGNVRRSDAGRGSGLSAGLAWAPLRKFRLNGSWSTSTDSLDDLQRFAPKYYGAPITVFDFATGESAQVLPILGGLPNLRQPHYDRFGVSGFAGPFTPWALTARVSWQRSNAVDNIGSLPTVTPELEAAFPDRFLRDVQGRLQYIDQRPLNFDTAVTETLSSNLSFTVPLGGKAKVGQRSILRVVLADKWQLRSLTVIHGGLPEMDRLAGDGGGLPGHQISLQADGRVGQWGANLATRWSSGYRVRRESGLDSDGDLLIGPIGTVDLRFSYFLRQPLPSGGNGQPARIGIGMQLALEIDNVFDTRPRARLGDGSPAPGYGRDDQDPIGRTIRLTLRRRF